MSHVSSGRPDAETVSVLYVERRPAGGYVFAVLFVDAQVPGLSLRRARHTRALGRGRCAIGYEMRLRQRAEGVDIRDPVGPECKVIWVGWVAVDVVAAAERRACWQIAVGQHVSRVQPVELVGVEVGHLRWGVDLHRRLP